MRGQCWNNTFGIYINELKENLETEVVMHRGKNGRFIKKKLIIAKHRKKKDIM